MQLHSGLQYVCMQINTYINTYILTAPVSFAFISTGHICTARHACTQTHIYQPFSLCVPLFLWRLKEQLPPKGRRARAKSAWLLRRHRRLFMCSADAALPCDWRHLVLGSRWRIWRESWRMAVNFQVGASTEKNPRSTFGSREGWVSLGKPFYWRWQAEMYGTEKKNKAHIPVYAVCFGWTFAVLSRPDSTARAPPPSLFFSSSFFFFSQTARSRSLSLPHSLRSCSVDVLWLETQLAQVCGEISLSPWRTVNIVLRKECKWSSLHLLEALSQLWMDFRGFQGTFSRKTAEIRISENAFEFRKRPVPCTCWYLLDILWFLATWSNLEFAYYLIWLKTLFPALSKVGFDLKRLGFKI